VSIFLFSNPFTEPLRQLLVWLSDLAARLPLPDWFSPYAVAIVAVAVLVKVVTQPLMSSQQKSMRKMQQLQPQIAELQKKFKDDREKLSQAQMELYRENGVNPFGGCLPLVVQMVVLFGLWRAIMRLATLADGSPGPMSGERFLWIPDLAACEPSPKCHADASLLPVAIPIMIILMVISQILYQRLMTPPSQSGDAQQQAMNSTMKFMPIMFAFIFLTLPSGVVLYYTTFNIVGLVQQSLSNRLGGPLILIPARVEAGGDASVGAGAGESSDGPQRSQPTKEQSLDEGTAVGRRRKRRKNR
jgi:YidC/Oxa1 family membrane protein insertase